MQYKIYCHANNNQHNIARYYQQKLVQSHEARLLVVRIGTQDNKRKATVGVGEKEKLLLARNLVLGGKASKIRRVYIPKSSEKLRLLGIPMIEDRAKQMLVKMALEPEWEAKFEE